MPEAKRKMNPKSLDNLRGHGFPKGTSGNPSGRPKSKILSQAYKFKLEDEVPNDPQGRTFAELIADRMIFESAKGNVHAASEIADRTEGKPQRAEQDQPVMGGVTINLIGITPERAQELLQKIELLEAKNASHA